MKKIEAISFIKTIGFLIIRPFLFSGLKGVKTEKFRTVLVGHAHADCGRKSFL